MSNAGVCLIKPEYLVTRTIVEEKDVVEIGKHKIEDPEQKESGENDEKRIKLDEENPNPEKLDPNQENPDPNQENPNQNQEKPKARGQNKNRPKTFQEDKRRNPCRSIIDVKVSEEPKPCQVKNCQCIHDPIEYLRIKPANISDECYMFNERGHCVRGLACRFSTKHITAEGKNLVDEEKLNKWQSKTYNAEFRSLQYMLERRKYDLSKSEKIKGDIEKWMIDKRQRNFNEELIDYDENDSGIMTETSLGAVTDEDIIKITDRERKTIDWKNKLYLSPLTTVGNLPFRRICKEYGADITCGEMALCESLLKGNKQEWALLKRHSSEDLFGVQICGPSPSLISKVAQVIEENINADFVDLNMGCPIDLVYQKGGGCGMMLRNKSMEASIRCASTILSVPLTVKMRTGVYQDRKIAHGLIPTMVTSGASLITLHGRSREARYSHLADWQYIEMCASVAAPCPVYGNGDILSYVDFKLRKEIAPTTQGVMIGRGALIKPWIFTEIKEQRMWDISSSERLDIIKKYVNYGLEHWGSDTMGVENTRRFLLEWLSFLYRYVPVGLLERPPQKINERPQTFFGRDDLETLMASGNCYDWIKISEMLLGPVPEGFTFLPKHKASAYK